MRSFLVRSQFSGGFLERRREGKKKEEVWEIASTSNSTTETMTSSSWDLGFSTPPTKMLGTRFRFSFDLNEMSSRFVPHTTIYLNIFKQVLLGSSRLYWVSRNISVFDCAVSTRTPVGSRYLSPTHMHGSLALHCGIL